MAGARDCRLRFYMARNMGRQLKSTNGSGALRNNAIKSFNRFESWLGKVGSLLKKEPSLANRRNGGLSALSLDFCQECTWYGQWSRGQGAFFTHFTKSDRSGSKEQQRALRICGECCSLRYRLAGGKLHMLLDPIPFGKLLLSESTRRRSNRSLFNS